jgi:hypothetical protein
LDWFKEKETKQHNTAMMSQQIVEWPGATENILHSLRYSQARLNSSGKGKTVSVAYQMSDGSNAKPVFQTPKMFAPFGFNHYAAETENGYDKYSIALTFKGDSPRMQEFLGLMRAIDAANVEMAFQNQEDLFGEKGKSRDIIEDRYNKIVNHKNDKYEPRMTGKLQFRNGNYTGLIFNDSAPPQEVGLSYIGQEKSSIVALVELGPIWIADKKFGQTINAIQMKVFKQQNIMHNAIKDDPMDTGTVDQDEAEVDTYPNTP